MEGNTPESHHNVAAGVGRTRGVVRYARSTKAPACVLRGHDRIGEGTARLHARGRDFNRPHLRPPGGAPRVHDHARDDDRVP